MKVLFTLVVISLILKSQVSAAPAKSGVAEVVTSRRTPKVIECLKLTTADDCDDDLDCTWCSASYFAGCYWVKAARYLPRSFFTCDVDRSQHDGEDQNPLTNASMCDGKPQAECIHPTCVWCTSAAVGAKCYTPEDAKKLPKAIFSCDFGLFA